MTDIDGRIIQTLRDLSLERKAANAKTINFERIALKFGLAAEAFETIHGIYHQFASVRCCLLCLYRELFVIGSWTSP